ncbi:hypothetical protein F444_03802 [Phytophthora nicotianae P1976]|uniref:Uncharacterized protein n=1 Tax=Phytophthora nicotianae P1976 TaxID=1317066 RepID=A0A081ASV8_PHYNI|nr:hypothetical protein F444_03802 [Phytophthora nicotianae P1976]
MISLASVPPFASVFPEVAGFSVSPVFSLAFTLPLAPVLFVTSVFSVAQGPLWCPCSPWRRDLVGARVLIGILPLAGARDLVVVRVLAGVCVATRVIFGARVLVAVIVLVATRPPAGTSCTPQICVIMVRPHVSERDHFMLMREVPKSKGKYSFYTCKHCSLAYNMNPDLKPPELILGRSYNYVGHVKLIDLLLGLHKRILVMMIPVDQGKEADSGQ